MHTKVIFGTWKADYLLLLLINGQRKTKLNISNLTINYNWRHIIKYNLAHMFQLCISKHGSSALRALGALAGSSVNFWGQCHLCNKGKWSLSLNSSNLHKTRRVKISTCHPRGALSLFEKVHTSALLPEGTAQCRGAEASHLAEWPPWAPCRGCRGL